MCLSCIRTPLRHELASRILSPLTCQRRVHVGLTSQARVPSEWRSTLKAAHPPLRRLSGFTQLFRPVGASRDLVFAYQGFRGCAAPPLAFLFGPVGAVFATTWRH